MDNIIGSKKLSPETKPDIKFEPLLKPGSAVHSIQIEIHTHPAYGLILGRSGNSEKIEKMKISMEGESDLADDTQKSKQSKKSKKSGKQNTIISLFGFALQTRNLVNASLAGDPYADMLLVKIEERMSEFDSAIGTALASVRKMITNLESSGVTAKKMSSKSPAKIELNFNSNYAMKLAMLIVTFDQMIRLYLPIRQLQLIDYDQWQLGIADARKKFRQTVNLAMAYQSYGLTRETARDKNNPNVVKLINSFGEIPDDIFLYEKRPKHILSNKSL